jgi:hypothetical protein
MNPVEFVQRQGELRSRLRRAVPRSERARDLERKLRDLLREELEQECRHRPGPSPRVVEATDEREDRARYWDR